MHARANKVTEYCNVFTYMGWNFNFGNAAVPFDTAHLQSSYFHGPLHVLPKVM